MKRIATVLAELGFAKVVGILDANKAEIARALSTEFPNYHFFSIPANDVRTKAALSAKAEVRGLLNDANEAVRPEYIDEVRRLFETANRYLGT